jgi:hypothetical protein
LIWVSPREEENILFYFKMAAVLLGNIKGEGEDPRIPSPNVPGYVRPQERLLHDPNVFLRNTTIMRSKPVPKSRTSIGMTCLVAKFA